jgi:hypothetical protein
VEIGVAQGRLTYLATNSMAERGSTLAEDLVGSPRVPYRGSCLHLDLTCDRMLASAPDRWAGPDRIVVRDSWSDHRTGLSCSPAISKTACGPACGRTCGNDPH